MCVSLDSGFMVEGNYKVGKHSTQDITCNFFHHLDPTAYGEDEAIYRYLRKLMALPFLLHNKILKILGVLSAQAQDPSLLELLGYIKQQWIETTILKVWHHALNRCAGGGCNLPLYLLTEILEREARITNLNIRLVSERKLKRIQRKTYRNQQEKLFQQWDLYKKGEKTTAELLRFCSHINGQHVGKKL